MDTKEATITVVFGPMYAGKTSELLRLVETAEFSKKKKVVLLKPDIDDRYDPDHICSHKGQQRRARIIPASDPQKIFEVLQDKKVDIVAIDEVQLFSKGIYNVIRNLKKMGIDVIACGLVLDFKEDPFGFMPQILALADYRIELFAVCAVCERWPPNADRTQRLIDGEPAPRSTPVVYIGAKSDYEARCRDHYIVPDS